MKSSVSRRLLCLGSLTVLGGCGFQPVYMPTASNNPGPAQREFAAINVPIIPERPGQLMRQALQERFGSDSGSTPARYDLIVTFGVAGEGVGIEANDIATRIRLIGNATYSLRSRDAKHTELTAGAARALDGANIFDSQYFAADQEIEAEQKRMAENIATQIATQLAVWFRQQAAKKTT